MANKPKSVTGSFRSAIFPKLGFVRELAGFFFITPVLVTLTGCLISERDIFSQRDAMIPPAISEVYYTRKPEKNIEMRYMNIIQVTDKFFAAVMFNTKMNPENAALDVDAGTRLNWTKFVHLHRNWFAVDIQFDAADMDDDHFYLLANMTRDGLQIFNLGDLEEPVLRRLAQSHGIKLEEKDYLTTLQGDVSPSMLVAYFRDLIREIERSGQEPDMAFHSGGRIPKDVQDAVFADDVWPTLVAEPADNFAGNPERLNLLIAYARALDARDISWGAYMLARASHNGWGIEQDFAAARRYAERAVALGLGRAKNILGILALAGLGEPKNPDKAISLYREAALAGEPRAMLNLSGIYYRGEVVTQNEKEGFSWLVKAAEAGLPMAQVALGRRYLNGEGVDQDDAKARDWFAKAAKADHAQAQAYLGWMYASGRGVEIDQKLATDLYLKAARDGDTWSQWQLGERLIAGIGADRDKPSGLGWIRKASEAGRKEATEALAKYETAGNDPTGGSERSRKGKLEGPVAAQKLAAEIMAILDKEIEKNENRIRKLCGGRICHILEDKSIIYRTENKKYWYFADGRLAPREYWPKND
jgi:TPR repeat protein